MVKKVLEYSTITKGLIVMDNKIFQDIYDLIAPLLPRKWSNIVFYAGYANNSYSMKFYYKDGKGKFVDCFNVLNASNSKLINTFIKINKILSANRYNNNQDKFWSVFTMTIDSKGAMKTFFDYVDHSEDLIAYEREWAKKYLH